MAPRPPRVGRCTSPSTCTRPMAAAARASSDASLTSETRRTAPGSSAPNSVELTWRIPASRNSAAGRPLRRTAAGSGARRQLAHRRVVDEIELLVQPHDRAVLRLGDEGHAVDEGAHELDP